MQQSRAGLTHRHVALTAANPHPDIIAAACRHRWVPIVLMATGLSVCGCQSSLFGNRSHDSAESYAEIQDHGMAAAGSPAATGNRPVNLQHEQQVVDLLSSGNAAYANGDFAGAAASFEQVLTLEPANHHAHHMLGRINDKSGVFEDATRHYLAALSSRPGDPNLLTDMGYSYMLQGRLDEAKVYLHRALKMDPDHMMATVNLGAVYAYDRDPERALVWLRKAATEQVRTARNEPLRNANPEQLAQQTLATLMSEPPPFQTRQSGSLVANLPQNSSPEFKQLVEMMQAERASTRERNSLDQQQRQIREREAMRALSQIGRNPPHNERPMGHGVSDGRINDEFRRIDREHRAARTQRPASDPVPSQQFPDSRLAGYRHEPASTWPSHGSMHQQQEPDGATAPRFPERWPGRETTMSRPAPASRMSVADYPPGASTAVGPGSNMAGSFEALPPPQDYTGNHGVPTVSSHPQVEQWPARPATGFQNHSVATQSPVVTQPSGLTSSGVWDPARTGSAPNVGVRQPIRNQPTPGAGTNHASGRQQSAEEAQRRAMAVGMAAGPGSLVLQSGVVTPVNPVHPASANEMPPATAPHSTGIGTPIGTGRPVPQPRYPDQNLSTTTAPLLPADGSMMLYEHGETRTLPDSRRWREMPQYDNVPSATWNMQNQQPLNRGFNHQSQPQPIGEEWQTGALASPTMHPEFAPRHYVTHETEAGAPDASHVRMNDVNELRRMANGQ